MRFAEGFLSPAVLRAVNPSGQEIDIPLPKRPGITIPDVPMLDILRQNNIPLRPLQIDLATFGMNWGFSQSAKGNSWMEKANRRVPETKVHLNLKAKQLDDIILIIERLGNQLQQKKLGELNNLYELAAFLAENGWPAR